MSDFTFNNPDNDPSEMSGSNDNNDRLYELITAYIDNELKDKSEIEEIENLINSDNNIHNRYIFENLSKETLKNRLKNIETPVYVYKNIGEQIDNYIKKVSSPKSPVAPAQDVYTQQINSQKSNLRKYLLYSSFAFILLVASTLVINYFLNKNPELLENDLVSVSRSVFDKLKSGQISPQMKSSNARELSDSMNKYLDFKVFIPDVKDAVLVGGVCNEINGEKLAHIIHQKGNVYIYTLQACKKHVMTNIDKIVLCDKFKGYVNEGKNWVTCNKDGNRTTVIWFKDSVICSTVAEMEPEEINIILTNYK